MKSKVVNRGQGVWDLEFEQGFGIEFLIDGSTTESKRVVMGHTIMPPSARNQAHVHENVEVVWTLVKGHTLHFSDSLEGGNYKETECHDGTFGYVNPGDLHVGINLSDEMRGEVVFCYAGANSKDGAGTVFVDAPDVVIQHLAERGLTLEDLDLEQRIE
ncbi:MAG: hypothetical protein ACRDZM_09475 [Acidimicrobiia bacterium]